MSGCTNTWRILDGWRQEECEKHGCLKGSGSCVCAQPFYLYTFPDRKKNRERRQAWSQNIKGDCGMLFITIMSDKYILSQILYFLELLNL